MSVITSEEVKKIAHLAQLIFEPEEMAKFVPQFQEILEYFQQLKEVSTEGVDPTYHALEEEDSSTPLRQDEVSLFFSVEEALGNAPDVFENHFRVPMVIDDR